MGCDPDTALSVSLVDDEEMADLNFRYRQQIGSTNVLAFSQLEGESPPGEPHLWGDVVISAERARRDAEELGYGDEEMVIFLLIHGILHLAGYDHTLHQDERTMEEKVQEIFDVLYPDKP